MNTVWGFYLYVLLRLVSLPNYRSEIEVLTPKCLQVANGMDSLDITVLTVYNGQRKIILRKLRDQRHLLGDYFKVVTVDSYQGEENGVILLSLVRCNSQGKIGFLEVENRVCVALSRAQRGFYLFGDGPSLCISSMLWWEVVKVMSKDPRRLGFYMPLTCEKHKEKTFVKGMRDLHCVTPFAYPLHRPS